MTASLDLATGWSQTKAWSGGGEEGGQSGPKELAKFLDAEGAARG
jgi:hypothetical protein